ncbi:MAG TPA: DNA/RNA nuclease SfsA, partial [Lentisphaeria bacterium]|nr:DNA/RNA nuclease SfsA [Lentisphaeria bacterium]
MRYGKVVEAKFLSRPNRFIAEVAAEEGTCTAHVKNTGRCRELLIPGCTVYLSVSDRPGRKTKYDLI